MGPNANHKCSIHHWSNHGIAGRGILLDYRSYADKKGVALNSYEADRISYAELEACGRDQGIDIRPQSQGGDIKIGDMLFIRSGFIKTYYEKPVEERNQLARRHHEIGANDGQRYAGVKQEDAMLDWLHDCYFATVAGDSPTFEAWPSNQGAFPNESPLTKTILILTGRLLHSRILTCDVGLVRNSMDRHRSFHRLTCASQSSRRNGRSGKTGAGL